MTTNSATKLKSPFLKVLYNDAAVGEKKSVLALEWAIHENGTLNAPVAFIVTSNIFAAAEAASNSAFDLIITDDKDTNFSAVEFRQLLHNHNIMTPIVLLVSVTEKIEKREVVARGYFDLLRAPFACKTLCDIIRKVTKDEINTPVDDREITGIPLNIAHETLGGKVNNIVPLPPETSSSEEGLTTIEPSGADNRVKSPPTQGGAESSRTKRNKQEACHPRGHITSSPQTPLTSRKRRQNTGSREDSLQRTRRSPAGSVPTDALVEKDVCVPENTKQADDAIYYTPAVSSASYDTPSVASVPSNYWELTPAKPSPLMQNIMDNSYSAEMSANNYSSYAEANCPAHSFFLSPTTSDWDLLSNIVSDSSRTPSECNVFASPAPLPSQTPFECNVFAEGNTAFNTGSTQARLTVTEKAKQEDFDADGNLFLW